MKSLQQLFVLIITTQYLLVSCKPIFKGLSLKKNYEMEISVIPFKHISFIKEKWFPFKMIGIKHDIAKREVDENLYSVNEVSFDNEEVGKYPGLLTNVKQNLDLNSEGEVIRNPAPVVENAESIHIIPITEQKNIPSGILHTSVMPINPSIVIAPSIQTTGSVMQPAALVPLSPEIVSPVPKEPEVQPVAPLPEEAVKPIQPLHTYVDVEAIEKPIESGSKLHTDISSVVPLNTLVAGPVQDMNVPLPVDIPKIETPAVEVPKVVEEIKVEPPVAPPTVETPSVIELPIPEIPAGSVS